MMKKFQCFEDIIDYLNTEAIPYRDNKQYILESLNAKFISKRAAYRKFCIVCGILLTLVVSVALTLGYIKEHENFVKAHDGDIKGKLTDDMGNIVIQIGVMGDVDDSEESMHISEQGETVSKMFEAISKSLEDKLSNDKIAIFIPVKDLGKFTYFNILNWCEHYYTYEDMRNSTSDNCLSPGYMPEEFSFREAFVFHDYENFYEPYEEQMTYKEFLTKLFEETKEDQKDYYYKEYKRSNDIKEYRLEYENINGKRIYLHLKKGKTTVLCEDDTNRLKTEIIGYNDRKYLKDGVSYYTYTYMGNDLWTISIIADLEEDEQLRILESVR